MAHQEHPLSPAKMQAFLAGLANLAPAEITKAKVLYIRNAIDEYDAQRISAESSKWLFLLFALVPLFWPFLYAAKKSTDAQFEASRRQIRNAIDVWADELRNESFAVDKLVLPKWF